MKNLKTILLCTILVCISHFGFTQNIFNINGTVTDANGNPVANCPVTIEGDSITFLVSAVTLTDTQGQYSVNIDFGNAVTGALNILVKDSCLIDEFGYNYINLSTAGNSFTRNFQLCSLNNQGCSAFFTHSPLSVHYPSTYLLDAVVQGVPPFVTHWNFKDSIDFPDERGFTMYTFPDSGIIDVTYSIEDATGCIYSFTDTVHNNIVNQITNVSFSVDTILPPNPYPSYLPVASYYFTCMTNGGTPPNKHRILFYGLNGDFSNKTTSGTSSIPETYSFTPERTGEYYVCVTSVDNVKNEAVSCKYFYLKNDSCIANLMQAPTNTIAHSFYARPKGTPPFTYFWDFGDGNTSHQLYNLHTYAFPGIYNVCLTVTDSAGHISTECKNVTISQGMPCTADFTAQVTEDTLQFTNIQVSGLAPFTYHWDFGDSNTDTIPNPTHIYDTLGIFNVCLTITDSLGCSATYCDSVSIFYNAIIGNVYNDADVNCILGGNETNLGNTFLQIVNTNTIDTSFSMTDSLGNFELRLDDGNYLISAIPLSSYWQSCAPQPAILTGTDTVNVSLGLQPIINCSNLNVNLSSPTLVYCYDETYKVNYCNLGTQAEPNAYVEVELDPFLTVNATSIPYTQNGNIYTFQIGNVNVNECGSFTIDFTVDCSANLGQIHCSEANIFPNQICLPSGTNWNGATITAEAICESNDSVRFILKNIGGSDMTQSRQYFVIEDQILQIAKPFNLDAGEDTTWVIKANLGSMYFLQAEQEITHPLGNNMPTAVSYDCYNTSVNPQLINQYGLGDAFSFQDIDCQQNVYSYDPNDKQGFPTGYNVDYHYITKNDDIEYMIRFQNTGTFTAFNVVVEDEIDIDVLDLTSVKVQGSSHPYRLSVVDGNVLKFSFNNIMLPDSTTNEPESHGFIRFKIAQKTNNPIGTVINNTAAIYFDFNTPVITNTTFHTVGENFITIVSSTFSPNKVNELDTKVNVFPNPFSNQTTFEITSKEQDYKNLVLIITDLTGKVIKTIKSGEINRIYLERDDLASGIYFYQLFSEGQLLDNGKIIAQ